MTKIYDYINFRAFLKDFLLEKKRNKIPEFSHKVILDRLGISSTGFLSNVVAGRKNLTPIQISRLSKILRLSKTEEAYFESMVYFTQAKVIDEKNEYFKRMVTLQKVDMKVLDKKKMTVFSKWYYVFVRELLNFYRYKDDVKALAHMVEPSITPREAQEAIEYLEELGLIAKDAEGYYKQIDSAVTSGDEVKSLQLAAFQMETMDLAKRSLQKVPAAERDLSVLTMTLSPDTFHLLKSELQHMRKRFAGISAEEAHPDRVYQLNIQFFPVTKKKEDGNGPR